MAYQPSNANGQATMANSSPVVVASNQSAIPVTDNSSTLSIDDGAGSITIDGTVTASNVAGDVAAAATDSGNPVKVGGKYNATVPTYTDGQRGDLQIGSRGSLRTVLYVHDSNLQIVNRADNADAQGVSANANNLGVMSRNTVYNGTSWDRAYSNFNTTTGDTGTKASSFTGATQTNFNARGAMITVVCGTVSGTSPTLVAQVQFSPDAGTTWINYGAANTAVTATNNTIVFNVYPDNGSPTTGATQTVNTNGPLPRTWRLNYTIGGTTPSFAITAVYVNYVV